MKPMHREFWQARAKMGWTILDNRKDKAWIFPSCRHKKNAAAFVK
jgi:hypothetical protein